MLATVFDVEGALLLASALGLLSTLLSGDPQRVEVVDETPVRVGRIVKIAAVR